MVVFLGFMAAITLVMWLAPQSPAGRALNEQLVERPLGALSRVKRHHLIYFVIMAGFMMGGGEVLALAGPEFVAAFAIDLAIYLDAVIVTYTLSALATARKSGRMLALPFVALMRRFGSRKKRYGVGKPDRLPSNDDEPDPVWFRLAA